MAHKKRRNISRNESRRVDPLIAPGGKVDPAAIFRAAKTTPAGTPAPNPDELTDELGDDDIIPAQPSTKQRVSFTLTRDLDKRLDKYLTDRITFLSRNKLQELIDAGGVSVNGKPAKSSTKLHLNDTVEVLIDPPPSEDFPPEDIPLDVLFEDEHMIVLNKSPDIIVHPARTHTHGTLINALAYHFRHRSTVGGDLSAVGKDFARPGVVHRLDRQTSGVIVFAKSETAHWKLAAQFEKRSTDKRYIAFVHGRCVNPVEVIDVPLGPHPSREKGFRERQVVRHDHLGKPALTVCRVLGRYLVAPAKKASTRDHALAKRTTPRGWNASEKVTEISDVRTFEGVTRGPNSPWITLLEVELKTGRTHQIRVHCSHLDHPLIGDDMYGGRLLMSGPVACGRVALHAARLVINHPISNERMTLVAPLPSDLRLLHGALRSQAVVDEPEQTPGTILRISDL